MEQNREKIMEELAKRYYDFLMKLPFDDDLYMKGIGEGKRKFLTNLHIFLATRNIPKKHKLYSTDFITPSALEKIRNNPLKGLELEYEHIVPKAKFIHEICENKAMNNTLSIEFIKDLLLRYLWTATVTKLEHDILKDIPFDWNGNDIQIRYSNAGITLLPHNISYLNPLIKK